VIEGWYGNSIRKAIFIGTTIVVKHRSARKDLPVPQTSASGHVLFELRHHMTIHSPIWHSVWTPACLSKRRHDLGATAKTNGGAFEVLYTIRHAFRVAWMGRLVWGNGTKPDAVTTVVDDVLTALRFVQYGHLWTVSQSRKVIAVTCNAVAYADSRGLRNVDWAWR
jgi:hypothetical protein